ncbi:MAG TPA: hypothetical protein VEO94_07660 [Candidatus Dormibacteraeota bacterium]|nr:hypothetical protein [Candidatus Dormibacteraeota bacterium]
MRPPRPVRGLSIVRRLPSGGAGFLTLERVLARNLYRDGRRSPAYRFEVVHRRGVDAVAILPFYFHPPGRLMIVCKVGFRPGLYTRSRLHPPVRDRRDYTSVVEAVAGSLEPGDRGEAGISARARAELLEETGMKPLPAGTVGLGSGFFPSHGQSTEKVHLRAFRVDPLRAVAPAGDGSVNEADAGTLAIDAETILVMCRLGLIEDPKLEIGVTRLMRAIGRRRTQSDHF